MNELEEYQKDLERSKFFLASYERQLKRLNEKRINPAFRLDEIKQMVLLQKEEIEKRIKELELLLGSF